MITNLKFQSPIDMIFEKGDWNSFYMDKDDWSIRQNILKTINTKNTELYGLLHKLFQNGKNDRLALYLPFNIIPSIQDYRMIDDNVDDFIDSYIKALINLQDVVEPLCNFTDGDIDYLEFICPLSLFKSKLSHLGYCDSLHDIKIINKYEHLYSDVLNNTDTCCSASVLSFLGFLETLIANSFNSEPISKINWLKSELYTYAISDLVDRVDYLYDDLLVNVDNQFYSDFLIELSIKNHIRLNEECLTNLRNGSYYNKYLRFFDLKINGFIPNVDVSKLKDVIYPCYVAYGSRIKGYNLDESDFDYAVFVKDNSADLRKIDDLFGCNVIKLFVEESKDSACIIESDSCNFKSEYYSNILFNGAWFGDYLDFSKKIFRSTDDANHLECLEKDSLQYRLLHKGFRRIDHCSGPVFLNDKYRLLATQLYLKKVFSYGK